MKTKHGVLTVAALAVAAVAIACSGATSHSSTSSNGGLGASDGSTGKPAKSSAAAAPKAPGSFDEGTFAVGQEVKAGTYQAAVPDDSSGCYLEVAKDDSGKIDSIVHNDNLNAGAHALVVLAAGQFFKTSGCGTWSPATNPASAATSFAEGIFRVGVDIAAGTYVAAIPNDSDGCYGETSKNGNGGLTNIVANDNLNAGAHGRITVKSGQWFKTSGCGKWTKS